MPARALPSAPALLLLAALVPLTACSSTRQSASLHQVDELSNRIGAVRSELEETSTAVERTFATLRAIVRHDFTDAEDAYRELVEAIARCHASLDDLRHESTPMERSAESFFERWTGNLEDFTSDAMRERSADRLRTTQRRYDRVADALELVFTSLGELNASLTDCALFLGNDFNSDGIAVVGDVVNQMQAQADLVQQRVRDALVAAQDYVSAAAPPAKGR